MIKTTNKTSAVNTTTNATSQLHEEIRLLKLKIKEKLSCNTKKFIKALQTWINS